jgi:hypothetical protein
VNVVVADPDMVPDTYVALTVYVPETQLLDPPVTNPWEYEPLLVLTAASPVRTVAPAGLLAVIVMYVVVVGVGVTVPNTVSDWAPE